MKGRPPRPDELDLWKRITSGVARRESNAPDVEPTFAKRRPEPKLPTQFVETDLKMSGGHKPLKHQLSPTLSQQMRAQPIQMDRKAFKRMSKGKLTPEAKIDLHGMTTERAHVALNRFIMSSHGSGKRLVLVITGKGKQRDLGGPIPVRFGVLRHQVPEWLRQPALASFVLQISEAHQSHGGSGAYYVYLRRKR